MNYTLRGKPEENTALLNKHQCGSDSVQAVTGTWHTADDHEETTGLLEEPFGHEGSLEQRTEDAGDDELRDHVRQYMRQLARTPLLTGEREKEVALRIGDARKELEDTGTELSRLIEEINASNELSRKKIEQRTGVPTAELKQLVERIKSAKKQYFEARNVLTKANLRLVVAIAKKYVNRGLSFSDLVQEGNVGLMKAAEKFDCRMGYRFSTYAVWWIKQAMGRALKERTKTIHVPIHMMETAQKVARVSHGLTQGLGREPSPQEIAGGTGLSVKKIRNALYITQEFISLETPVSDGGVRLVDLLEDKNAVGPEGPVLSLDLVEGVNKALSRLTAREEKVIRMRFGIGEPSAHTLKEVAQTFGLTRERVRQIEGKALKKLRLHAKAWEP